MALAAELEWGLLLATEDAHAAYGEVRLVGFAPLGDTLYCVAFTEEDDAYRIISLRPARPREVRYYARHI